MIQLANFEERTFYVMLGKVVTSVDVTFTFQMTEEEFTATIVPVSSSLRATKFTFQATGYPEGQYIVKFVETGQTTVLATVAGFVSGNPIFATSQYNTYNDDGTSTTYVPSDDQGLVPSVSQKLRVSTVNQSTDVSYVRYIKVTNGTLTDNGDNSVTITTGAGSLEEITDVLITGTPIGQFLQYDGISGFWKNVTLNLSTLADTKGNPTEGQFLKYTGGFWQPSVVDVALNNLSDVSTSGQQSGYVLVSNGTSWSASTLPMLNGVNTTRTLTSGFTQIDLNANISLTSVTANSFKATGDMIIQIDSDNNQTGRTLKIVDGASNERFKVDESGNVTINGAYKLPLADGSTNQILKTNGSSTLSFGANLQDLDNVATLTPSAGQVLTFVGSEWQPASPASPPPAPVTSVNTLTGAVVLDTDDVSEGTTNLYYTDARVSANTDVVANTAKRSYPLADETKLAGIAAGAEVNVNADWNASSGDAQILNKPSIPSAIGDLSDVPSTMGTTGQLLVVDSAGTALEYVEPSAAVVTVTAATTLSSAHANKYIVVSSASAINITVPASASYDATAEFIFEQYGAGQITIVADTGVTINSTETLKSAAQYAVIGLKRTDTNRYTLTGERELV